MPINIQPAEKRRYGNGDTLEVHSIFHTIQGEGPFVGRPSVFVRLAGCNLACPRCDTDYTSTREARTPSAIVQDIWDCRMPNTKLVVITGGEPFRQNLVPFVNLLLFSGFEVQIETNGTLYQELPYERITVVCSPKTGSINHLLAAKLSALKYVISSELLEEDGYPRLALDNPVHRLARPPKNFQGKIYLQPYDSGEEVENVVHRAAAVAACFTTGHTLCLQTHKLLGLE